MTGLFRGFALRGRDWLRKLPREDRQAFGYLGSMYHDHGRMGGKARASKAQRDARGRFTKAGEK